MTIQCLNLPQNNSSQFFNSSSTLFIVRNLISVIMSSLFQKYITRTDTGMIASCLTSICCIDSSFERYCLIFLLRVMSNDFQRNLQHQFRLASSS
mmetsp:Transcript_24629/g.38011  ORF Transcript_24629/g.38011 Transcript_24629/m.38011 type:complete len:95 (-) Transcript_24629:172-456(-)